MKNANLMQFPVVGLGASAGGLEAVGGFLSGVEAQSGLAYVLVQHLDPSHESMLAELLSRRAPIPVRQIEDSEALAPDTLFVIPPGFALRVENARLYLDPFSQPRGLRRPIDDFFESLAVATSGECAVVVLSGTGADGTMGIRRVKGEGGLVVAQDSETAAYDGMPESAIRTGLADHICAPKEMPALIASYFERNNGPDAVAADDVLERLGDICEAVGEAVGHDFSNYKHSTLVRRVRRRMQVVGSDTAVEYLSRLRADNAECSALFSDILINVTEFFRDKAAFETLDEEVIRPLAEDRGANDSIRVWVPGCSSGEEAYSIAMLIDAALRARAVKPFVQIFATDIDEAMLEVAKSARYPVAALADIPEEYRDACTVSSTTHFQIAPHIRDMVRISPHSLVKDPPFSRLDMISCRNLLIYMNGRMQDELLPLFHYALKPGGTLFLGPAESASRREDLFRTADQKARIYRRKPGRTPEALSLPTGGGGLRRSPASLRSRLQLPSPPQGLAQRRLLDAYTPAHVLVGANGEMLETSGRLGRYFSFPTGTVSTHITTLALPGLRGPLGDAMQRADSATERVVMRDLSVESEFGTQVIDLIVDPLPDGTTLVVIRDVAAFRADTEDDVALPLERDARTQGLEEALDTARLQLRTTVEELETTNEELKSSNEEMMSMNEELQSANEELTTVNDELKSKIDKLAQANDDQSNFLTSTDLALIVLDADLNIRLFTEPAQAIFPLSDPDIGRALDSFAPKVDDPDILADVETVRDTGQEISRNVLGRDGDLHYFMRILPYRTSDGTIEGVTLTFADTTVLREAQVEAEVTGQRLELALAVTGVGVWEAYPGSGKSVCDASVRDMFGLPPTGQLTVEDILSKVDPRDLPALEANFGAAIETGSEYRIEFRVRDTQPERWLVGIGRLVEPEGLEPRMVGVNYDITDIKEAERQQGLLVRELDHRVKNLFAVVLGMLRAEARRTDDCNVLVGNVESRLSALARAHDASRGENNAETTRLEKLVSEVLGPYGVGERVILKGEKLMLPVHYTTPLGLILHELATNAQKYGALSGDEGRVEVSWKHIKDATGAPKMRLRWSERGGPRIAGAPETTGFGFRLLKQSVAQLQGRAEPDWSPEGLVLDVVLPMIGDGRDGLPDSTAVSAHPRPDVSAPESATG